MGESTSTKQLREKLGLSQNQPIDYYKLLEEQAGQDSQDQLVRYKQEQDAIPSDEEEEEVEDLSDAGLVDYTISQLKHVAHEVFYPTQSTQSLQTQEIFEPAHGSSFADAIGLQQSFQPDSLQDNSIPPSPDTAAEDAFIPENPDPLSDVELARDVFFPHIHKRFSEHVAKRFREHSQHKEKIDIYQSIPPSQIPAYLMHIYTQFQDDITNILKLLQDDAVEQAKEKYMGLRSMLVYADVKDDDKEPLFERMKILYEKIQLAQLEQEAQQQLSIN